METIKDVLNFCNAAVFYDYKNIGIIEQLKQVRTCILKNFHETKPVTRILITLSFRDDIILKIHYNETENFIENLDDSRSIILYMLGFEKLVREEVIEEESN